jgi:Glycosyl transferase family 2
MPTNSARRAIAGSEGTNPELDGWPGSELSVPASKSRALLATVSSMCAASNRASAQRPRALDQVQGALTYAVVTPVRDDAENLRRLAELLEHQERRAEVWVIVDTGSTDDTLAVARSLAEVHRWVTVRELRVDGGRGGPIVKAFHLGLEDVPRRCDVVVKLDADLTFEPDYFRRLLRAFELDDRLGITSGTGYEEQANGVWKQRHGTGAGVWGASRAYRRQCLDAILPLEERMGWDTIDAVSAIVRGWDARVVPDLPFRHHRREGERETSRFEHWAKQGRAAHYMGYRIHYLAVKTLYRSIRDPQAVGIVCGYLSAVVRGEPRCADPAVLGYVRREQALKRMPERVGEALRHRALLDDTPERDS